MKKNSGFPLSLLIAVLLIIQQMLTIHVPAQIPSDVGMMRRSAQAIGSNMPAGTNIVEKGVASRTVDAVELGYDHPPFVAGERIPVFRMRGGNVFSGDECFGPHYHSDPNIPRVTICKPGGGIAGPFRDMNNGECGHGQVKPVEARFEATVEAPQRVARGAKISYVITVKNVGQVDFDGVEIPFNITLDTRPVGADKIEGCPNPCRIGLLMLEGGQTRFEVSLTPDTTGTVRAVFQVRGLLKCDQTDVFSVDTSMPVLTTEVVEADVGPTPQITDGFDFGIIGAADPFTVAPINNGNVIAGLAVLNNFNITFLTGDMTGGFTIGIGPSIQDRIGNLLGADFNGDGRTDIAATDDRFRTVFTFLQNGSGGFQPPISSSTQIDFNRIAVGDLNGDGVPDIVGASESGMLQVMRGDGQGRFTSLFTTSSGLGGIDALAGGNFNGDSFADVLVGANDPAGGSQIGVFLSGQNGSLGPPQFFGFSERDLQMATGDINGDGRDEIITASTDSNTISIIDPASGAVLNSFPSGGQSPVDVAAGDLNGDARIDLAVANRGSNMISIFLGTDSGDFFNVLNIETPRPAGIRFFDLNGDGGINGLDLIVFRDRFRQPPPQPGDSLQPAEADPDSAGITVFLNGVPPLTRAVVEQVERRGKHLIVTCSGCAPGARVLVDGVRKKTILEPDGKLRAKKAARQIKAGQSAVVQVESEGKFSEWFIFRR